MVVVIKLKINFIIKEEGVCKVILYFFNLEVRIIIGSVYIVIGWYYKRDI